jgi:hypothetical protein
MFYKFLQNVAKLTEFNKTNELNCENKLKLYAHFLKIKKCELKSNVLLYPTFSQNKKVLIKVKCFTSFCKLLGN